MKALGILCIVAWYLTRSVWVPDQNVEQLWLMQAQLSQKQKGKQQYWSDVKTWSASASQSVTWLFLGVGQAILPHLKEESLGYLQIKMFLNFHLQIAIFKPISE